MRPVRRGASPQTVDYDDYQKAKVPLVGRMGLYCSFCERHIPTGLAVEHIQAKSLTAHTHLAGNWQNFLLGCVNCNSTKSAKDVDPAQVFLPDRDNTFAAFLYREDGTVHPSAFLSAAQVELAKNTLALTGQNKKIHEAVNENEKLVAMDRIAQRMETWATAQEAKATVNANPTNADVRTLVIDLARATGFFSIWMAVFEGNLEMRQQLIDAFLGTRASECFIADTTLPRTPAPNPDGLPHGGKV